jgi:Transglutaminase-like superfamily
VIIKKFFLIISALLLISLSVLTNVSTTIDPDDRIAIPIILGIDAAPETKNFHEEIRLIRFAQKKVMVVAPDFIGIPDYHEREPLDLLKAKSGLCFDRSRTLDKIYTWLGFEARHVYILYGESQTQLNNWNMVKYFFSKSQSHAVTEVKTSRGWILVDSNSLWISLNKDGLPIPANQIYLRQTEFEKIPEYFKTPYWAFPGMYSRRGHLYKPYIPLPEFNWPDFFNYLRTD